MKILSIIVIVIWTVILTNCFIEIMKKENYTKVDLPEEIELAKANDTLIVTKRDTINNIIYIEFKH